MEQSRKWRFGVNRWIVLALIIVNVIAVSAFPAMRPHIQLPAEVIAHEPLVSLPVVGDIYLTNTLVATLLGDILLLLIGFGVYRAVKSGQLVPKGISGVVEAFIELLYNMTESTAGKWARRIFPYFATITLLVLVVNWTSLLPGVDSFGLLDKHHIPHPEECNFIQLPFNITGVTGDNECAAGIIPFLRAAATDLNFTLALAIVAMVMVQVIGFSAQGLGYLVKFINTKTVFSKPIFGVIDLAVGLLELISEISKVLSFTFRLFGNVFAGAVLLFVIGTLVPVFAQTGVLMLEFFVGAIQAIVFGLLTMTFMAQATQGHGHEEHHEEGAPAH